MPSSVMRQGDDVAAVAVSDLDDDQRAELAAELPDGSSALVLAIEHLWAIPLRDAARDAGGLVLGHRTLTPEDLVALGMVIGVESAAAEAGDEE